MSDEGVREARDVNVVAFLTQSEYERLDDEVDRRGTKCASLVYQILFEATEGFTSFVTKGNQFLRRDRQTESE